MDDKRPLRVGHGVPDHCRVCKMERTHTVVALESERGVARVRCDTCFSLHDYRGGGRPAPVERASAATVEDLDMDSENLERLLRRVIREESGLTPVAPADKWRGGELVLKPGREGLQPKSLPIETFFAKVVMLRNRLRVLEQQVNASDIPDELKIKLQGYVTACYGSLTSFNVLFADEEDRFKGSGGGE